MRTLPPDRRGRLAAGAALALAALLAACGGSDHSSPPVTQNPSPPPVATDAYVTYVLQQTATSSDTAEPGSIDGVAATAPETSEPIPLSGT